MHSGVSASIYDRYNFLVWLPGLPRPAIYPYLTCQSVPNECTFNWAEFIVTSVISLQVNEPPPYWPSEIFSRVLYNI